MNTEANSRPLHRRSATVGITTLLLLVPALVFGMWWMFAHDPSREVKRQAQVGGFTKQIGMQDVLPVPLPQMYKPITSDEAQAENAALPFSRDRVESAQPLVLPVAAQSIVGRRPAIDCLTAAIYYEGGNEPIAGKRGIAQVVLNRVRHPAFPNTVCGVVYQGWERSTGCQFTFTCDGSLRRRPNRAGWDAARAVAVAALNGQVESLVGMATHYHADYVVPYWAPSLDKIVKLGTHIFYRWRGSWGRRAAFDQAVSLNEGVAMTYSADLDGLIEPIQSEGLTDSAPTTVMSTMPRPKADEIGGELLAPSGNSGPPHLPAAGLAADRNRGVLKTD